MVFDKLRNSYIDIVEKLSRGEITAEQAKELRKALDKELKDLNKGLTNLIRAVKKERA